MREHNILPTHKNSKKLFRVEDFLNPTYDHRHKINLINTLEPLEASKEDCVVTYNLLRTFVLEYYLQCLKYYNFAPPESIEEDLGIAPWIV